MARLSLSLLLAFGLLAASSEAAASKEGLLPLNAFALESPGIGQPGPVKVSGAQSDGGISLLRIEAFGRNFTLQPQQLRSFKRSEERRVGKEGRVTRRPCDRAQERDGRFK